MLQRIECDFADAVTGAVATHCIAVVGLDQFPQASEGGRGFIVAGVRKYGDGLVAAEASDDVALAECGAQQLGTCSGHGRPPHAHGYR